MILHYIYSRLERHLCFGIFKLSFMSVCIVVQMVRMSRVVSVPPHACSSVPFTASGPHSASIFRITTLCPIDTWHVSLILVLTNCETTCSAFCPKSNGVINAMPYMSLYPGPVTRNSQADLTQSNCLDFLSGLHMPVLSVSLPETTMHVNGAEEAFSRGPSCLLSFS